MVYLTVVLVALLIQSGAEVTCHVLSVVKIRV